MSLQFPIEGSGSPEKYAGTVSFQAVNTVSSPTYSSGAAGQNAAVVGFGTTETMGGDVILYLPQGINIADAVNYENTDLGIIGNAARNGLNNVDVGALLSKGPMEILSDATSLAETAVAGLGNWKNLGTAAAISAENIPEVGHAISSVTGITANPHRRSIFRDVGLRQFSFSFTMQPMSEDEAGVIEDIVKFFRTELYPEKLTDYAYRFPTKFLIEFQYNGQQVANKLQPCYMTSVQTQYNPNSSSFHTGGKFTETVISLTFQEETTLTKEKIVEGF